MRSVLLVLVVIGVSVATYRATSVAEAPPGGDSDLLIGHLETAMARMDLGLRSPEYRESLAFLRAHAGEIVARLRGLLLEEPGSFRKWQLTYLMGELGDEHAIALLREVLDRPIPVPQSPRPSEHEIDLRYTEELTSRIQAVMSTARIARHRPELRDEVVATLLEVAREVPIAKSTALFELRKLLGPESEMFRAELSEEDAKDLDRFIPPPEWQSLLSQRIAKHERQRRDLRESREPVCRRD